MLKFITISLLLLIVSINASEIGLNLCELDDPDLAEGLAGLKYGSGANEWNYVDTTKWGDLVTTCKTDQQAQSPVDLPSLSAVTDQQDNELVISYWPAATSKFTKTDKSYTLELEGHLQDAFVTDKNGNRILYAASQWHYHHPSEHTLNGESFDAEIHFVHVAVDGFCDHADNAISVLGMFFKVVGTEPNAFLDTFLAAQIDASITNFDIFESFLKGLDKTEYDYITYSGSLTTPPCFETVNWYVLTDYISINQAQLDIFKDFQKDKTTFGENQANNRPVQNINGRTFQKGKLRVFPLTYEVKLAEEHEGSGSSSYGMLYSWLIVLLVFGLY